jgi:hypothetical protein
MICRISIVNQYNPIAISVLENADTMGERIGRIGRIYTDFLGTNARILSKKVKKIRFNLPNPPNPFSHCITFFQSGNC